MTSERRAPARPGQTAGDCSKQRPKPPKRVKNRVRCCFQPPLFPPSPSHDHGPRRDEDNEMLSGSVDLKRRRCTSTAAPPGRLPCKPSARRRVGRETGRSIVRRQQSPSHPSLSLSIRVYHGPYAHRQSRDVRPPPRCLAPAPDLQLPSPHAINAPSCRKLPCGRRLALQTSIRPR